MKTPTIGIALVGVLFFVGIFLWSNTTKSTLSVSVPVQPITYTEYQNKSYGFTASLPDTWDVKDGKGLGFSSPGYEQTPELSKSTIDALRANPSPEATARLTGGKGVAISVAIGPLSEEFYGHTQAEMDAVSIEKSRSQPNTIHTVMVGGVPGALTYKDYNVAGGRGPIMEEVYLAHGDSVYQIYLIYAPGDPRPTEVWETFLQSFTFTK